jgi:hypothetical protein
MTFDIGPFRLYRPRSTDTLDISLICLDDLAIGWEWGWKDAQRGNDRPIVEFRIGKLVIFYLQLFKHGFEVWFFGFWWIK